MAARVCRRPWVFVLLALSLTALVLVRPLVRNHGDISNFIIAGDKLVDIRDVPVPIKVRPDSWGYDGEFYFRLALDPTTWAPTAYGVTLDAPAWRIQRIFYPVLVHVLTGGHAALVPAGLVLVNLAGLAAIAGLALRLRRRLNLPDWFPLLVMGWPGLAVTLTHDTTEITALTLVLAALNAYFAGRYIVYAGLAALATLTRETSILLFGGIFAHTLWRLLALRFPAIPGAGPTLDEAPGGRGTGWLLKTVCCLLALLPFLIWRQVLTHHFNVSPQAQGGGNMTWPFMGFLRMMAAQLRGGAASLEGLMTQTSTPWTAHALFVALMTTLVQPFVLITAGGIMAMGGWAATRLPIVIRAGGGAVVCGWLVLAALMSLMSANGPWIDSTSYFRAFSEFWLLTCLLLGLARVRLPRPLLIGMAALWLFNLLTCTLSV